MSIFTNPTVIIVSALLAFVAQMVLDLVSNPNVPMLEADQSETIFNSNVLQNHPRCGIISGGREECWWNCTRTTTARETLRFNYFMVNFRN